MADLDDLRYPIGRFSPPASRWLASTPHTFKLCALLPERLRAAVAASTTPNSTHPIAKAAGPCARWCIMWPTATPTPTSASSWRSPRTGPPSSPTTKPPGPGWPTAGCPSTVSLAFIEALHARWVALLESLTEEDFQKGYNHPERGPPEPGHSAGNLRVALAPPHRAHHQPARAQGLVRPHVAAGDAAASADQLAQ